MLILLVACGWLLWELLEPESPYPPRYRYDSAVPPGAGAGPTHGMALSPDGYGTVTDAPPVLAPMADAQATPPGSSPSVAPDVARFVRAWPREVRINRPPDGLTVCTAEGPPVYPGKLVLVDGCLRLQREDSAAPGPLVLAPSVRLFRDSEHYLAVGLPDAAPEHALRVGEPGGVLVGVGCSMDSPVPAPPDVARQCGVSAMLRLGSIKRKPVCSPAYLEQRRMLQRQEKETAARLQGTRDACLAQGTRPDACPPAVFPPNIELFAPPCRPPDELDQSSHLSSTQP